MNGIKSIIRLIPLCFKALGELLKNMTEQFQNQKRWDEFWKYYIKQSKDEIKKTGHGDQNE